VNTLQTRPVLDQFHDCSTGMFIGNKKQVNERALVSKSLKKVLIKKIEAFTKR
jgi:hypothetical protein